MRYSQPSNTPTLRSSLSAWLRLIRLPNLLTAPGDPLAGYLLAAGSGAVWSPALGVVMAVAVLLYMAGLIMNDVVDVRLDAQERPDRPLPSRRVDETFARLLMLTLMAAGLVLARHAGWPVAIAALALLVCITLYNVIMKNTLLGPLFMGLCRGLSLYLGAALVPGRSSLVLLAAGGLVLYVMAVTLVARGEVAGRPIGGRAVLPLVAVAVITGLLLSYSPVTEAMQVRLGVVLFLLFSMAGLAAWRLWDAGPRSAPPLIGLLLSAILFLQAAFCIAANAGPLSLAAGMMLLFAWPLNRLLARFFAAS